MFPPESAGRFPTQRGHAQPEGPQLATVLNVGLEPARDQHLVPMLNDLSRS